MAGAYIDQMTIVTVVEGRTGEGHVRDMRRTWQVHKKDRLTRRSVDVNESPEADDRWSKSAGNAKRFTS